MKILTEVYRKSAGSGIWIPDFECGLQVRTGSALALLVLLLNTALRYFLLFIYFFIIFIYLKPLIGDNSVIMTMASLKLYNMMWLTLVAYPDGCKVFAVGS